MPGFRETHDMDSGTTFCPCGKSYTAYDDRRWDPDALARWMAEHTPHTTSDEVEHSISDDGMRACSHDQVQSWVERA